MNLSTITDLKELKAMAYDELAQVELHQANARAINNRIVELSKEDQEKEAPKED